MHSCSTKNKEIVAEVNNEEISSTELSEVTKQELFDILNQAYNIKSKALDDLIKKKILEKEAKKNRMSINEYIDHYIAIKTRNNLDNIKKDFKSSKSHPNYIKNKLYNISANSIAGELSFKNKLYSAVIEQLVDSLYNKSKIKKYLYPPKQPICITKGLPIHYKGNLKSPTTFIVASDYTCDRCTSFEKTLQRIYEKYKNHVKFGFINFSDSPTLEALATEAAAKQNKFWSFHDSIFSHEGYADSTYLFNLAKKEKLNISRFRQDLSSAENYKKINNTISTLMERGLYATPTIIINNRIVYITNSFEELTKLLDHEINH